jgi:hypothetical protein
MGCRRYDSALCGRGATLTGYHSVTRHNILMVYVVALTRYIKPLRFIVADIVSFDIPLIEMVID